MRPYAKILPPFSRKTTMLVTQRNIFSQFFNTNIMLILSINEKRSEKINIISKLISIRNNAYGQRLQADMCSENNNVKLLESECFFLYKQESISFFQ